MKLNIEELNEGLNKVMFKGRSFWSIIKACPNCCADLNYNPPVNRPEHYNCPECNKRYILKKNNDDILDMVEWR